MMLVICATFAILWATASVEACIKIKASSQYFPSALTFQQVPWDGAAFDQESGRPIYRGDSIDPVYLYHGSLDMFQSGEGYWIISRTPNHFTLDDQIIAKIESWAVLPHLIDASQDSSPHRHTWIESRGEFLNDATLTFTCLDNEPQAAAVYFHSSPTLQRGLSGFYIRRTSRASPSALIYSQIKVLVDDRSEFLFRLPGAPTWLIGEQPLEDAGRAFLRDPLAAAADQLQGTWSFLVDLEAGGFEWRTDPTAAVWSVANTPGALDLHSALLHRRSLRSLPTQHTLVEMRNGLLIPQLGLGTGGIPHDQAEQTFAKALETGYRMFDLAREYQNEHILGPILQELALREEAFLISKVWPTDFGFVPTTRAVQESLEDLRSDYVDLMLLHWAQCDPSVWWMHCETTQEPTATWRTAYKVLEKLYAEGQLMALGVSNFDIHLLEAMKDEVSVLPHAVQNFATLGQLDEAVRSFCMRHHVVYQPYASMRNLATLPDATQQRLHVVSQQLHSTPYEIVLHCLLRGGAVMIPRSSQLRHLRANIAVPSWTLPEDVLKELGCDWKQNLWDEL